MKGRLAISMLAVGDSNMPYMAALFNLGTRFDLQIAKQVLPSSAMTWLQ